MLKEFGVGWTLAALLCLVAPTGSILAFSNQSTSDLAELAQQSIVYIHYDVTDGAGNDPEEIQGTGFVVSKDGHVLTAAHVIREWLKQPLAMRQANPIKASLSDKPGTARHPPLTLEFVSERAGASEDVALLRILDAVPYVPAAICFQAAPLARTGDPIFAYGFPYRQGFQPVSGHLGTQTAPGGRWFAASAFTHGMSGGPVYYISHALVMGIVKGGLEGTDAVRWITPIAHARPLLETAGGFQEQCLFWRLEVERQRLLAELRSNDSRSAQGQRDLLVALQVIFEKLVEPAKAANAYVQTAEEVKKNLQRVADKVSPEAVAKAKAELERGSSSLAKQLLIQNGETQSKEAAESLFQAGRLSEQEGSIAEADDLYVRAASLNPGSDRYALARFDTAYRLARYDRASDALRAAKEIKKASGQLDEEALRSLDLRQASVLLALTRYREAEALYLAHKSGIEQTGSLQDRASYASFLGSLYHNWGRYREAEPLLVEALRLYSEIGPHDSTAIANSLSNLAYLRTLRADYGTVARDLERAIDLLVKKLGPRHFRLIPPINNLARYKIRIGEVAAGTALLEEAREIGMSAFQMQHTFSARTLDLLAEARMAQGIPDDACRLLDEALRIKVLLLGEQSLEVARTLIAMTNCLMATGKLPDASEALRRARGIVERGIGTENLLAADLFMMEGRLLSLTQAARGAFACFAKAFDLRRGALGMFHPDTVASREAREQAPGGPADPQPCQPG